MTSDQNRETEELKAILATWLSARIDDADQLVVDKLVNVGAGGFSAETAFLDVHWQAGGKTVCQPMVLRRQILGHDLLHQPELEFQAKIMDRLSQKVLSAPVPELVGLERDTALLGTPFLVMKRLYGQIVSQNPNYNVAGWLTELPLERRAGVWFNGIRAMAAVHKVDWRDDLAFMARGKEPGLAGYVSWLEDWVTWAVAGRDYPIGDATLDYLKQSMPGDTVVEVVWGDGQPSNILFNEKTGEVTGLLDWELATLGPGEIDLAWWLMFDELFSDWLRVPRLAGLPDREAVIACYEQAVGRPASNLDYYDVLARLRMAIIAMRATDRQVALGNYKADNDAWSHNPFTVDLARRLGIPGVEIGADYYDFTTKLMAKGE